MDANKRAAARKAERKLRREVENRRVVLRDDEHGRQLLRKYTKRNLQQPNG